VYEALKLPVIHSLFRVKRTNSILLQYPTESLFQPSEHIYVYDIVDGKETFTGPFVVLESLGEERYRLADPTTGKVIEGIVLGEKLRDRVE